jgi:hydroxyacylglutathione hydrolase
MVDVTPIRAFSDNYIWMIHGLRDRSRVAVVDPGDAAPVVEALDSGGLTLGAILVTHHHRDHVGGVTELRRRYSVEVIGPAGETIPDCTRSVRGGERFTVDAVGLEFVVVDVPGHTKGHIAYFSPPRPAQPGEGQGEGLLFCGDTLFSAGCGRLFEGTAAQMTRSLSALRDLPKESRVFCGHEYTVNNLRFALAVEPDNVSARDYLETARGLRSKGLPTLPSTLALEIQVNPFLRCNQPTVQKSAERHAGRSLDGEVEVFATIRRWKDGFN